MENAKEWELFMLLYYSTHVQWQRMWSLRKCEYSGLDIMDGGAEAGGVGVYCGTWSMPHYG